MAEDRKLNRSIFPPGFSSSEAPRKLPAEFSRFPPPLRTILVADGTVTKLLEAHFWQPIRVTVITQEVVTGDFFGLGSEEILVREASIGPSVGAPYAHAYSRISLGTLPPDLRSRLVDRTIGIGALLRERRLETYRELVSVVGRTADDSASALGIQPDDPIAERVYRICREGRPFIEIRELFPVQVYGQTS